MEASEDLEDFDGEEDEEDMDNDSSANVEVFVGLTELRHLSER
jgi:hypothetical protein